jgi:PEP-CTERM motif
MTRKILLLSVWVGLMAVLFAPSASASPIVTTELKLDGTWQYTYDLVNDTGDSIYDFGIDFFGDPLNITAPTGWEIFSGNGAGTVSGLGFIDWFSPDPVLDLAAGLTLTGFSFQSTLGPGPIPYRIVTSSASLDGTTTGPNPVPEPGTLLLLGTGISMGIARRRRLKLQA